MSAPEGTAPVTVAAGPIPTAERPVVDDNLEIEGRVFGRYLVGRTPSDTLVERYCEANRTLFATPPADHDAAVIAFARRHSWSVGLLDAAAGLLRAGGPLRSKLLILAAILEASPDFSEDFLPRQERWPALGLRLVCVAAVAVVQTFCGVVLHFVVSRVRL